MPGRPEEEEGVFVGAGAFRVDRNRALETLKERQLEDPADFSLPWIRTAVLSGATFVRFKAAAGGVELSFDGRPLEARFLEDPYACLLDDTEADSERHAHLATGLLAAIRLNPRRLSVLSGSGVARVRLDVVDAARDILAPASDQGHDTFLRAEWDGWRSFDRWDYLARPCLRTAMLPIPLYVNDRREPSAREAGQPRVDFELGGTRGVLLPAAPDAAESLARLHLHGVQVQDEPFQTGYAPVLAHLDDPGFRLNASQSRVVQAGRFGPALGEAARRVPELIESACREQARRAERDARRLFQAQAEGRTGALARGLSALRGWLRPEGADPDSGADLDEGVADALTWDGRVAAWLRRSVAGPREGLALLRATPLFLGATGGALSVDQLAEQAGRIGYVPASRKPAGRGHLPIEVVWCMTGAHSASLERIFSGHRIRWMPV